MTHADRRHHVWRVRKIAADGRVSDTRLYVRRAAADQRAQRWLDAGYLVQMARTPLVAFTEVWRHNPRQEPWL